MVETLPTPKAILFDWDNTLVDTWPIIHQALHDTMHQWGLTPWTLDEVKLKVGKSMRDAFPEMFGDTWEEAGRFYLNAYRSLHLQHLTPLPDVLTMLEYVRETIPFVGVVSNKRGESLRIEAAHMGWEHYFDVLVGAGDAQRDKPHADPALLALEKAEVKAGKEVWFVGDTTTDLECAAACGMTAILYGDVELDAPNHYRGFSVHYHAPDHEDLLTVLRTYA